MYNKVENKFFAKVGTLLFEGKRAQFLFIIAFSCSLLWGCASSDVSRDVTSNIDVGVQNAKDLVDGASNSNIADSYQNSSQRAKGAIIGGTTGALVGGVTSGVGVLPGAAVGAILGGSYGSYVDKNVSLEDQLQNRGATVVVLGDQILIVLPSARIFNAMTARIKPDAYSTLNLVARYVNQYTKMLVKVAAYTNNLGSSDVNLSLSQDQAEHVAKFLVASGLDARVLYAVGYGGTHLVQENSYVWDGSDNYRIEITLEKQYV